MEKITHPTVQRNSKDERIFRQEFATGSYLAKLASGQKIINYNPAIYPFAKHIRRLLIKKGLVEPRSLEGLDQLENLHRILPESMMALDDGELNEISRSFYENDAEFVETYELMLKNVIGTQITKKFVFQSTPTIRFHFPREGGFNWNPRFHSDIMLGHPPQEINLWLAICGARDSASMSIASMKESVNLLESFDLNFSQIAEKVQNDPEVAKHCVNISRPAELEYGQILAFDSRCLHATQFNNTDWTRISLDFRIIPWSDYKNMRLSYQGAGRRKMPFLQGHYYDSRASTDI